MVRAGDDGDLELAESGKQRAGGREILVVVSREKQQFPASFPDIATN
jgi:hypothetical protein